MHIPNNQYHGFHLILRTVKYQKILFYMVFQNILNFESFFYCVFFFFFVFVFCFFVLFCFVLFFVHNLSCHFKGLKIKMYFQTFLNHIFFIRSEIYLNKAYLLCFKTCMENRCVWRAITDVRQMSTEWVSEWVYYVSLYNRGYGTHSKLRIAWKMLARSSTITGAQHQITTRFM